MENTEAILWVVFAVSALLYWWAGRVFIARPVHTVPEKLRHPVIARLLVLLPRIALLAVVITGFKFTDDGWWYLGAVVVAVVLLAAKPMPYWDA